MPDKVDKIARNLKRFKLAAAATETQRKREQEDLSFQTPEGAWDASVRQQRGAATIGDVPIPARPMLSVAPVDEPIQLVSNQERSAHLAASFHPESEDADDDTAQVLQGLYDQGTNHSNAGTARSWAYERVLWCGVGWYRLDKVYDPEGGHPFDQKIVWKRMKYQGNNYPDPFAQEADKSDRNWHIVVDDIPLVRYKQRWPKSELAGMNDGELTAIGSEQPDWIGGDGEESRTIRVAEVWDVQVETKTWRLYSDGGVYASEKDAPDGVSVVTGDGARSRDEEVRTVTWMTMNCYEELDPEQEWDGQYIPIIPVIGRELQPFDGKERTVGMIAGAKDSARMINYAASGAVEMASLEPKAPFEWDPRQIEGYEQFWHQANTRNFPGLPYHAIVDGQPMDAPKRTPVDVSRLGPNMQILSMGGSMLQSAMSTFDPALGKQPTAHRSGRALEALQGQTQEANSHYLDNLATISIPYEAKVWLDLAPKVYDRPERVVRILKGEGQSELVMLGAPFVRGPNGRPQPAAPGDPNALHFDLSKGRYGVSVTVGKSSASRLQQGSDALTTIIQAEPALLPIVGPEWMRFQDFPGSKTLSKLFQKMRDHDMPWLSDRPQGNPVQELAQTKQQLAALTQAAQQMKQQLETDTVKHTIQAQADIALQDLKSKTEIQIQAMKDSTQIEVARITAAKEAMIAEREAMEESIALNRKITADAMEADKSRAHEVATHALDHGSALTQAQQLHEHAVTQSDQEHQQTVMQSAQENDNALQQADAERQAAEAAQPISGGAE
jgi:hypothetical protein